MTVTAHVYGLVAESLAAKKIDYLGSEIKVSLHDQTYVPNRDSDQYWSSTVGEVSGGTYVHGGMVLTGKTQTYDSSTHTTTLSAADIKWPSSTITAYFAVFYANSGVAANSALLCYWDFGGAVASSASDFILSLNSSGLVTFTAN